MANSEMTPEQQVDVLSRELSVRLRQINNMSSLLADAHTANAELAARLHEVTTRSDGEKVDAKDATSSVQT